MLLEHLKMTISDQRLGVPGGSELKPKTDSIASPSFPITDIRSLKDQKKPETASEMAALVAFYLSEVIVANGKKDTVNVEDMVLYFKQAGYPLPKSKPIILHNA